MRPIDFRSRAGVLAASILMMVTAWPATAHHSFEAEYDASKLVTVSGFVTKLDWRNPHAFIVIDSGGEKGAVRSYRFEMGPPYSLVRNGWARDTVKIGDRVTVEGAALAKDGSDAGGSLPTTAIVLGTGQKLIMR